MDDAWGYWSTDGMGLLEYLEWCEQLGAKPMLAVFAGYTLNHTVVPQDQLQPYVQDALDEIQYATGSTSTYWGKKRAEDGHPTPFKIDYVEIGNEDFFDNSGSYNAYRFPMFYDAIKKAYPKMNVVATTSVTSRTPDVVDDHFYNSPQWMNTHAGYYDNTSRTGPKIMVGEWASQEGRPTPDQNAAVGDASWLTGLMRNSDLVTQEAYAPMLVNVNNDGYTWATNLIGFNTLTSYGSPSYYAQQMLAGNHGDQVISGTYSGAGGINTVATKDSRTGKIYLTIVNPSGYDQPVTVDLAGVGHIAATGKATVLAAADGTATNTITQPTNVVPHTEPITGVGSSFTRDLPANSITVLTLG
jgi:alpha-L-arabinofuranosidase